MGLQGILHGGPFFFVLPCLGPLTSFKNASKKGPLKKRKARMQSLGISMGIPNSSSPGDHTAKKANSGSDVEKWH